MKRVGPINEVGGDGGEFPDMILQAREIEDG